MLTFNPFTDTVSFTPTHKHFSARLALSLSLFLAHSHTSDSLTHLFEAHIPMLPRYLMNIACMCVLGACVSVYEMNARVFPANVTFLFLQRTVWRHVERFSL